MATVPNTTLTSAMLGYVTGLGVNVPDAETCRKEVIEEFRNALGIGGDWNFVPETILGRFIEAFTIERLGVLGTNAYVAQQINLYKATGHFLDGIGALFQSHRIAAQYASVRIQLTATSTKCVIPQNTYFIAEDGTVYILGSEVKFEGCKAEDEEINGVSTTVYRVITTVEAQEGGARSETAVKISGIVGSFEHFSSVSTVNVISYGSDKEADSSYRQRLISSRWTGQSFVDSISTELNKIDKVMSFTVIENVTNLAKRIPNFTTDSGTQYDMSGHSVLITVQGGDSTAIAEAIFRTKSVGATMLPVDEDFNPSGSSESGYTRKSPERTPYVQHINVKDTAYAKEHEIIFNRPIPVNVILRLDIEANKYVGSEEDLKKDITTAINRWTANEIESVEGCLVGESLFTDEVASALTVEIPSIRINNVKVAKEPPVGAASDTIVWQDEYRIAPFEIIVPIIGRSEINLV